MRDPEHIHYQTMVDLLKANSTITDRGITFIKNGTEERFCSYQDLFQNAVELLYYLQQHQIEPGTEVLFQIEDNQKFLNAFWACLLGGLIPVPVTVGLSDEYKLKVLRIWEKLRQPFLISSQKSFAVLAEFALNNHFTATLDEMKRALFICDDERQVRQSGVIHQAKPDDIAFIQFSSGSTSEPKGVILTHQNLLSNIDSVIQGMKLNIDDRTMSWMPLTHDMGLIGYHLTPTAVAMNHFLIVTSVFIRQPSIWMQKASEHQATVLSSPNFGYKHFLNFFSPKTEHNWDLASIRLICNGAEPICEDLARNFLKTLEPNRLKKEAMFPVYGLAEATLAVTFPPLNEELVVNCLDRRCLSVGDRVQVITDETDPNQVTFVDEGYPLNGCQVRICRAGDQVLDELTVGHIQIRGANVTQGYYRNEDATKRSFTQDGWLVTGDLGFLRNGRLTVTGRFKDIIFAHGQNYYPQDLERITEAIEQIELGKIVACGVYSEKHQSDQIIFFVLFRKKLAEFVPLVKAIKTQISSKIGLEVAQVVPVRDIPKTTSGKIQRYILKDKYLRGEYDQVLALLQNISDSGQPLKVKSVSELEKKLLTLWEQIAGTIAESSLEKIDLAANSLLLTKYFSLLEEEYSGYIIISDLFTYPTIPKLAQYISEKLQGRQSGVKNPSIDQQDGIENKIDAVVRDVQRGAISVTDLWKRLNDQLTLAGIAAENPARAMGPWKTGARQIAIIGLAFKFPGANNSKELWDILLTGQNCIKELPVSRQNDCDRLSGILFNMEQSDIQYAKGGYLDAIDQFDHVFFQLTHQDAKLMDPHQRLFLETAWSAIEDSGYSGTRLNGSKTGVFLGYNSWPLYGLTIFNGEPGLVSDSIIGNIPAVIPGRLSYLLNLKGPSMLVDTACSSSLVAIHLACQAIRNHECELALAGGVKILLNPVKDLFNIGIESEDFLTRTFDEQADGSGWGEGAAAVLLKPLDKALEDHDQIYAVIKGSAVNQDGASAGITAPNAAAQEEVLLAAWRDAEINPDTLSYIEAHGTGTKLGDPIEIDGIRRAFQRYTNRKQFCALGSVKTNFGHLDSAAGVAGLIKAILALKQKQLPPTNHFLRPNRKILFEDAPVFVNDRLRAWEKGKTPRRCGVSAFGISGTNCHLVLEEAPEVETLGAEDGPEIRVLALSANDAAALKDLVLAFQVFLTETPQVAVDALCYTANTGRGQYSHRLAIYFKDCHDLRAKLNRLSQVDYGDLDDAGLLYGGPEPGPAGKRLPETWEAKRGLDLKANALLKEITALPEQRGEVFLQLLVELGKLYVQGAAFSWEPLYQRGLQQKISIPGYPLQHQRCWLEFKKSGQRMPNGKVIKPMAQFEPAGRKEGLSYTETCLAELWSEVLGCKTFDKADTFYELGGNSLKATFLVLKIQRQFNVAVSLREILSFPTIQGMSQIIMKAPRRTYTSIKAVPERDYYPVSSAQKRMFITDQCEGAGISYNIYNVLEVEGDLSKEQFEETLQLLIKRHESLRTSFELIEGEPVQRVWPEVDFKLSYQELTPEGAGFQPELLAILPEFIKPFDLRKAPLLRAGLVKLENNRHLFMIDTHHIIADGVSMNIMIRDFAALYNGAVLPELRIQYKDFAEWQNKLLHNEAMQEHEKYWLDQFGGEIPTLHLPTDLPRPAVRNFEGRILQHDLERKLTGRLNDLAGENESTCFIVFLAAFYVLLYKYTGQEDIVVGTTQMGRQHPDLENIIGMFVNTLALRMQPMGQKTVRQFLREVKEKVFDANRHQEYQFENLVSQLKLKRDPSRNPLFDVCFNMIIIEDEINFSPGKLFIKPFDYQIVAAKFDLTFNIFQLSSGFQIKIEYQSHLFKDKTIENFYRHYLEVLHSFDGPKDLQLSQIDIFTPVVLKNNSIKESGDFKF